MLTQTSPASSYRSNYITARIYLSLSLLPFSLPRSYFLSSILRSRSHNAFLRDYTSNGYLLHTTLRTFSVVPAFPRFPRPIISATSRNPRRAQPHFNATCILFPLLLFFFSLFLYVARLAECVRNINDELRFCRRHVAVTLRKLRLRVEYAARSSAIMESDLSI